MKKIPIEQLKKMSLDKQLNYLTKRVESITTLVSSLAQQVGELVEQYSQEGKHVHHASPEDV